MASPSLPQENTSTTKPRSWSQLRAWDRIEEDEIRRFEHIRDKETTMQRLWQKFSSHPIPFICLPGAAYCIFAGLNALQTGHTYMALKYLEARIAVQGTGVAAILFGSLYYNSRDKHQLMSKQPFGPYKHGYGKTHRLKKDDDGEFQH